MWRESIVHERKVVPHTGQSNCDISVRPGSVRAGSCAAVEPRRHVQPQLRAEPLGWRLAGRPVPVGTRRANKVAPSGPERDITNAETDERNEANRCMSLRPKQNHPRPADSERYLDISQGFPAVPLPPPAVTFSAGQIVARFPE
eukprot:scaffold4010_cov98-Phaeocystis_antarctica.AAC.5